jgi:MFS family permease
MVSGLIAPMLMGFMADKLSWRIPFGLEILIVLAALFLAFAASVFFTAWMLNHGYRNTVKRSGEAPRCSA